VTKGFVYYQRYYIFDDEDGGLSKEASFLREAHLSHIKSDIMTVELLLKSDNKMTV
jgi:hypothetical protein